MNVKERFHTSLNGEAVDKLPLVHFGFWPETLAKWAGEGHISRKEAAGWIDGNKHDLSIGTKLGFDFNWYRQYGTAAG